ncbi:MAG: hypothetical protein QUS66_07705 [Bacteroidota bacterium]|nr:hypothetical protein [Bacteroidota bacterium]
MKQLALLLVFTAFSAGLFCQDDTTSVSYVAYWSVGDSYDFRVRKTSMQWTGDSLTKDEISEYTANFEVVDSTETSYTVVWTYSNELINTWDIPEEMLDELSKYEMSEVVYTTTEMGEFIGIENWEELSQMVRSMFNDIFRIIAKDSGTDHDKMMQAAQPFLEMYSSKEGIEQMVLPELKLFHFPFGAMIPVGDTIRYEDQFPNLLCGDPIRADAKLWFEEVDFSEERSLLVQESRLNREDTMVFLKEILSRMGAQSEEMTNLLSEAVYTIDTFNRYDYYYYPGVPVKIDFNRHVQIDIGEEQSRRDDTISIELL